MSNFVNFFKNLWQQLVTFFKGLFSTKSDVAKKPDDVKPVEPHIEPTHNIGDKYAEPHVEPTPTPVIVKPKAKSNKKPHHKHGGRK